ncbi:MAG: polysaccharide lyase family 8 super-sandwich domain-containing protein [Bacteroidales bacterium]|nr:polysaccharide lyase beta-sandwich domain-containing protein [Bacteroidales bacterium]
MRYLSLLVFFCCAIVASYAMTSEESAAISALRTKYSNTAYHSWNLTGSSYAVCIAQLQSNGQFTDFIATENSLKSSNSFSNLYSTAQHNVNNFILPCFNRLWRIAENYRKKTIPNDIKAKLYQSILYYGALETSRANVGGRFSASCFTIPIACANIYYCLLPTMDSIENGKITDAQSLAVNSMLKTLGMQAWTQPYRDDSTDNHVVSVNRFRNHVWWVGGNALAYRALLPAATMLRSADMVKVVTDVAIGSLSVVTQTTYDSAFWTEGLTADGAGWGHGKQCLIWDYPVDGISSALGILSELNATPWVQKLDRTNVEALMNYVRRSAFYYQKGYAPPLFTRANATANKAASTIRSLTLVNSILSYFSSSLTSAEIAELNQFKTEANNKNIVMDKYPNGSYHGSRYFFNNDDLVKINKNYMIFINMASWRVCGLESALADGNAYNFYSADGTTLFQRSGDEYVKAIGAMNQSAMPGITARQINNSALVPITHWRGFNSKHHFAAGTTSFGDHFAGGFIFEKQDASVSEGSSSQSNQNPAIYGVKAYKGYFMFGDIMVAMGAGITNLNTSLSGNVYTTVEQTLRKSDLSVNGTPITDATYSEILKSSTDNSAAIKWVCNNGFTFGVVPAYTTGEVKLTAETRNTIWKTLSPSTNKSISETTTQMVQLHIDHGKTVTNGSYVYFVSANGIPDSLPKLIANTTALQAAASADSTVIGAVFYDDSQSLYFGNYSYKLSSPAALLIEKQDNSTALITVTDAKMDSTLKQITLTTTLPISGDNVTNSNETYFLNVPLPEKELCGSPVTVQVALGSNVGVVKHIQDKLQFVIKGHHLYFSNPVRQLSVYNLLGINVVRKYNANECSLPLSGMYLVSADGKEQKVLIK